MGPNRHPRQLVVSPTFAGKWQHSPLKRSIIDQTQYVILMSHSELLGRSSVVTLAGRKLLAPPGVWVTRIQADNDLVLSSINSFPFSAIDFLWPDYCCLVQKYKLSALFLILFLNVFFWFYKAWLGLYFIIWVWETFQTNQVKDSVFKFAVSHRKFLIDAVEWELCRIFKTFLQDRRILSIIGCSHPNILVLSM